MADAPRSPALCLPSAHCPTIEQGGMHIIILSATHDRSTIGVVNPSVHCCLGSTDEYELNGSGDDEDDDGAEI